MKLSVKEFEAKINADSLRIAFIGMSNIGKSHLATMLGRIDGFCHFEVDKQIQNSLGFGSMAEISDWLGFPWDKEYKRRASKYLQLEARHSLNAKAQKSLILDTTGSVVHIDNNSIKTIKQNYLVIYLKAKKEDIAKLRNTYFQQPKPTIWGDYYKKYQGLSEPDSLLKSYPGLLAARDKLYSEMADIIIDASGFHGVEKGRQVLQMIKSAL